MHCCDWLSATPKPCRTAPVTGHRSHGSRTPRFTRRPGTQHDGKTQSRDQAIRRVAMARLTPITSKDQVAAKDHAIVDAIVGSRGALQGPFSMFLHSPEIAGRVAHLGAFVPFEGTLDMRVRVLAAMTAAREFEAV